MHKSLIVDQTHLVLVRAALQKKLVVKLILPYDHLLNVDNPSVKNGDLLRSSGGKFSPSASGLADEEVEQEEDVGHEGGGEQQRLNVGQLHDGVRIGTEAPKKVAFDAEKLLTRKCQNIRGRERKRES